MSFKDEIKADAQKIFLNELEFADEHLVSGKQMTVLIDESEIIERQKKEKSNMDGIYTRKILMYVRPEDFGPLPAHGTAIKLDGQMYLVTDAVDEYGVYSITMEANRSYGKAGRI